MYPFTRNTDYLQLESHRTREDQGENWINIREDWYNLDNIDRDDVFVNPSWYTISGQWLIDGGDEAAEPSLREKRAYCRKGKATFTFTGTSVSVRIYTNPLYGSADVRIDGVLPSTLANVKDAMDVLDCDAYNQDETWGQEYLDIILANNISDEEHTVELYAENDDAGIGGWFIIAGYKVPKFTNKTREIDVWIMPERTSASKEELSIYSRVQDFSGRIIDIEAIFGGLFVDSDGVAIGTITNDLLFNGDRELIEFWPDIDGTEQEGIISDTIQLTAKYEDPDGVEIDHGSFSVDCTEFEYINIVPMSHWFLYNRMGRMLLIVKADGAYLEIDFFGTWVRIGHLRSHSPWWGHECGGFDAYIDDVSVGYVECGDTDNPYWTNTTFSGLANTEHELKLMIHQADQYVFFEYIAWEEKRYYTEVQETITYNFNAYQVPPFAPENPRFLTHDDENPTCDVVNFSLQDLTIPRDNADVTNLWLEKRPATFAVCYQSGFEKILKTYDIVIVEPKALTRTIVKAYQDLGIKVLCYQSYGEEVGSYENEWDISSATVPLTGDGEGPGGYASYYNKGGNQFGECSECKHDRRRLEGIDECAKNQTANYEAAAWAGRCLSACTKDCRTCYGGYTLGYNCAGGHNKNNYYSRTAMKACTNSDCPDYNPVHGGCPFFEAPDETMYGQDFSMFTTWMPDENGIWKSFYTNPREQSWNDRLKNHYLSTMFDVGIEYTEIVTVTIYPTTDDETTVKGFKISNVPIDSDEDIIVTNIEEDFTYVRGQDYLFDSELGTFFMQVSSEGAPEVPCETKLSVTYTRKGLQADGVFLDTLDTVDVYTSDEYKDAMVDMIREHHDLYPDKLWAMNRGFTILERLMPITDYVMFESFITTINWDTGDYYEITDPAALAANQVFIDLLFRLREIYTFNVLGLNYCDDDDDALKQTIAEKVRAYGWLSWNSTISLNNPQENTEIFTKDLYIESNIWRLTDELDLP